MRSLYKAYISVFCLTLSLSACAKSDNITNESTDQISISSKNSLRDVSSIIKKANAVYQQRNPEIIKLKYKYMSDSAFAFYRATAYLFYMDVNQDGALRTTVKVPLQGDLHLENIGTYLTSNKKISYDLNDFDDAFTGSYTWELARCATSIDLAANESGIGKDDRSELVDYFLKNYKDNLQNLANNSGELSQPISASHLSKPVNKAIEKVLAYPYSQFITDMSQNNKFVRSDKVLALEGNATSAVTNAINSYAQSKKLNGYKVKDVATYIAGKGSLGRYRYIALLEGPSTKANDDIILEIKEATQPASTVLTGNLSGNQAQRVVQANKYFVAQPDPYLNSLRINNNDFFVRQLLPNEKVNLAKLDKKSDFKEYLDTIAYVVARAHAKSGKASAILTDFSRTKDAIADFSKQYRKQVNDDFNSFKSNIPN